MHSCRHITAINEEFAPPLRRRADSQADSVQAWSSLFELARKADLQSPEASPDGPGLVRAAAEP